MTDSDPEGAKAKGLKSRQLLMVVFGIRTQYPEDDEGGEADDEGVEGDAGDAPNE